MAALARVERLEDPVELLDEDLSIGRVGTLLVDPDGHRSPA
jgi:hypothetical protein